MPNIWTARNAFLLGLVVMTAGCSSIDAGTTAGTDRTPIVFVHGNGDNASLFIYTAWRFESNGWPRERLFAFDLPDPLSRDLDDMAQPGRSSAGEYADFLRQRIAEVRRASGAQQVILVGNSRGGYPIRYFLRDHKEEVAAAVLGGTPNHGTFISASVRPTSEYNGAGAWLSGLNTPQGAEGNEIPAGVRILTLRSDHNDKYAQTTGAAYGVPDLKTNIDVDAPALRGADNQVLPGVDHRETVYSAAAFAAMFRFLTGASGKVDVTPMAHPSVSGHVYSISNRQPTNQALAGTEVTIYRVDPRSAARLGDAVMHQTVDKDGKFGPVTLDSQARYEFVLAHAGYSLTHIFFGALLRSTDWLDLTLQAEDEQPPEASTVSLVRIAGYFNTQRDHIDVDGTTPATIITPIPTVNSARVTIPASQGVRPVTSHFNDETIVVRSFPNRTEDGQNQRVVAELLD